MEKVILIHYSEIALKKGNRKYFEQKLNQNILKATNGLPKGNLKIDYGRFVLSLVKDSPVEKIVERLKKIMGIAYFSVAFSGSKDIEVLREQVFEKVQNLEFEILNFLMIPVGFQIDFRMLPYQALILLD